MILPGSWDHAHYKPTKGGNGGPGSCTGLNSSHWLPRVVTSPMKWNTRISSEFSFFHPMHHAAQSHPCDIEPRARILPFMGCDALHYPRPSDPVYHPSLIKPRSLSRLAPDSILHFHSHADNNTACPTCKVTQCARKHNHIDHRNPPAAGTVSSFPLVIARTLLTKSVHPQNLHDNSPHLPQRDSNFLYKTHTEIIFPFGYRQRIRSKRRKNTLHVCRLSLQILLLDYHKTQRLIPQGLTQGLPRMGKDFTAVKQSCHRDVGYDSLRNELGYLIGLCRT